jgi:hypothetical protein
MITIYNKLSLPNSNSTQNFKFVICVKDSIDKFISRGHPVY